MDEVSMNNYDDNPEGGISRRHFLVGALSLSIAMALYPTVSHAGCSIFSENTKTEFLEGLDLFYEKSTTVVKHFAPIIIGGAVGAALLPAIGITAASGGLIGMILGAGYTYSTNKNYLNDIGVENLRSLIDNIK